MDRVHSKLISCFPDKVLPCQLKMYGWTKDKRRASATRLSSRNPSLCLTDALGSGYHFEFIRLLLAVGLHLSFSGKIWVLHLQMSTHFCSPKLKTTARRFCPQHCPAFVVKPLLKLFCCQSEPLRQLHVFVSPISKGTVQKIKENPGPDLSFGCYSKLRGR